VVGSTDLRALPVVASRSADYHCCLVESSWNGVYLDSKTRYGIAVEYVIAGDEHPDVNIGWQGGWLICF